MSVRPDVVVFDVLETLLDLAPLEKRFEQTGQPASMLGPWFLRFQRDAMALTLAGDEAPFEPVARQAMRTESHHSMREADIDHVLGGFGNLPTFDDTAPALRKLSQASVQVACLTVGSPDNTRRFLEGAGLAQYVDHVITAKDAGVWKPHPDIYRFTAAKLGIPLDRMALVAVHAWDCHGAKRAGAMAGWCARLEGKLGDVFVPADVSGETLVDVVEGLLAL